MDLLLKQDIEGEYEVVLTIVKLEKKMAGQTYTLEVSNGLGTTKYQFDLALSDKPPTGEQFANINSLIKKKQLSKHYYFLIVFLILGHS
jgi:hypothetical protein